MHGTLFSAVASFENLIISVPARQWNDVRNLASIVALRSFDAEELSQALSQALSQGGAKSKYSKEDRRRNQL